MKCKFRVVLAILILFIPVFRLAGQDLPPAQRISADTFNRHGFAGYEEAADTLWKKLAFRKISTLLPYTVSDSVFKLLVRRRGDTVTPNQFVYGQWIAYKQKVEKSYKKTYKQLRKKKFNLNRSVRDTLLVYRNKETPDQMKVELYFRKNKTLAYFRFHLWRVEGEWYYVEKIIFAEETARLR